MNEKVNIQLRNKRLIKTAEEICLPFEQSKGDNEGYLLALFENTDGNIKAVIRGLASGSMLEYFLVLLAKHIGGLIGVPAHIVLTRIAADMADDKQSNINIENLLQSETDTLQ